MCRNTHQRVIADIQPNFDKALPMQAKQKKHAPATTLQLTIVYLRQLPTSLAVQFVNYRLNWLPSA